MLLQSRHVTTGTIIIPASLQPGLRREAATPIGVALQAAVPVIGHLLNGCGLLMRVVTGNAPEPATTGAEAAALMHLLNLADHAVLSRARGRLEYRPDLMERQPWPKVLIPTVDS